MKPKPKYTGSVFVFLDVFSPVGLCVLYVACMPSQLTACTFGYLPACHNTVHGRTEAATTGSCYAAPLK